MIDTNKKVCHPQQTHVFEVLMICDSILLQHHCKALQAPGVQEKPLRQQILVEGVEGTVMFSDGLN